MGFNDLEVKCYSGYTYAERPYSFLWQGVYYDVMMIEKDWLEPQKKYFQVRTKENRLFQLCYNETEEIWSLVELVRR